MDAWIGLFGAIVGFVVSEVVNNFTTKLQFERERRWQRDRLLLDKLSEIASLAEDIQQKLSKLYAAAIFALGRTPTIFYNEDVPFFTNARLAIQKGAFVFSLN